MVWRKKNLSKDFDAIEKSPDEEEPKNLGTKTLICFFSITQLVLIGLSGVS